MLLGEQARIAAAQASAGTAPCATVLSVHGQAAITRATIPPLEQKTDQATDLLAALVGATPATFRQPVVSLAELALPEEVPLTVPSQLVRQRPDVLVADAVAAQTDAVGASEKALRLLEANYQAGLATYLQVLVGDTQYLQARIGWVQAVATRLQDTVALYVALGGGWDPESDSRTGRGRRP